jgi:hypothetical protein
MMYVFFWVIPRRLIFICRIFGTLCSIFIGKKVNKFTLFIYLLAYEDGTDRVFRKVGISNSDAGELPRRKHTTY